MTADATTGAAAARFTDDAIAAATKASLSAVPYLPISIVEQEQLVRAAFSVVDPASATPLPDEAIRDAANASLPATSHLEVTFAERLSVVRVAANHAVRAHRSAASSSATTHEPEGLPAGLSDERLTSIEAHTAELVEAMDGSETETWQTMVNHLILLGAEVRRHRPTTRPQEGQAKS